jgi:hypothetical protein
MVDEEVATTRSKTEDRDSPFPNHGSHEFSPPAKNAAGDSDWVLLLNESGANGK